MGNKVLEICITNKDDILDNMRANDHFSPYMEHAIKIIEDMEYAQSTLLPQVNKWINQYFNYIIGTHHATIKYIDGVSPYTRKVKRKEVKELVMA